MQKSSRRGVSQPFRLLELLDNFPLKYKTAGEVYKKSAEELTIVSKIQLFLNNIELRSILYSLFSFYINISR